MYHGLCGLSSLQLTLPEGTQPRFAHTVTSFRLDEETVHTIYAIFLNKAVTSSAGSNEARVDNIIHTMYVRPRPEAQLSTCLLTVKDK